MLERLRPRFVETRRLADGSAAFYFRVPTYYRELGCEIANEPLGTNYEAACGEDGKGGRAAQAGKDCALRHHRLVVSAIQDGEGLY